MVSRVLDLDALMFRYGRQPIMAVYAKILSESQSLAPHLHNSNCPVRWGARNMCVWPHSVCVSVDFRDRLVMGLEGIYEALRRAVDGRSDV